MIGRGYLRTLTAEESDQKGFDAFELRLGDLMRGERATMGKSLIDVQRELKIKAAYIAAIENADPSAFDTPGFIAGYVRSYARYLNMDPDWAFETFCRESGFSTTHGMAPAASAPKGALPGPQDRVANTGLGRELFTVQNTPFLPASPGWFANLEPRAVGSVVVLAAVLSGLGYGGWMVMREIQKVTFAPVEAPPAVVAELDPLDAPAPEAESFASFEAPSAEALDRLYRPEALDTPVLVPRDGPIASLDPASVGTLPSTPVTPPAAAPVTAAVVAAPVYGPLPATAGPSIAALSIPVIPPAAGVDDVLAGVLGVEPPPLDPNGVQVTTGPAPKVELVATGEAWVRVNAPDGSVLYEGILQPGDTFEVPATEAPATLRVGESGSVFMAVNGVPYGPVGPSGQVTSDVALSPEAVAAAYQVADLTQDAVLADYAAVASASQVAPSALPAGTVLPTATVAPITE